MIAPLSLLVVLFALPIALVGLLGVVSPERLTRLVRSWQTPAGLYLGAAFRLVRGLLLFLVAPGSRAPGALRVLGVVLLVAGLTTPAFGLARLHRLLAWWAARGPAFKRAWAGCALALGLFLIHAVTPGF